MMGFSELDFPHPRLAWADSDSASLACHRMLAVEASFSKRLACGIYIQ